jgi:two-component system, cell cycle sensor histidine kinase and response regulator CckA
VLLIGRRTETIRHEVAERTAELAESRRQFAQMLHALPGMAYRCRYDDQLSVIFLSEGARNLTGWTAEEFINGTAHFRDCIHPDDLGRVRDATRAALQEQKDVEVEYRIRTRTGEEKWVLSRGRGVYTADGDLTVFEGLAIDITAQKTSEAARLALERKLLEGQKLESLGLLAGGIAHDFNNLLSSILGNASLARLSLPASTAPEPHLRAIEAASMQAAELCRQMLAYAGKGRFVIEPTDLTVLTEDLLPLLKISISHQATLKLNLARNLPAVLADATQLRQIVMNLVLNAVDAIGTSDRQNNGEIALTTGVMHADHTMLSACVAGASLARGDYVFLEVRDNGAGMTREVREKIFDPFFTTKFAGRGLGLAAVLGIVRGHHGALRVESTPGIGSSFRLLLPPGKKPAASPKIAPSGPVGRWKHSGNVLVVEDEAHVRAVLVEILKSFGLTPAAVGDGHSAVSLFRQNPGAFDLVLLDLLMPGMSGEETLEELRAIKPDVRALLVSGYSETDLASRLENGRSVSFLSKPFTCDALERKLRDILG